MTKIQACARLTLGVVAILLVAVAPASSVTSDGPRTTISNAPGRVSDEVWPKPVGEFLDGKYLERADVILTRRSGDLSSALIRWATSSPFSHAALVFTGPKYDAGVSSTFVIEAGTSGVDLTRLKDYAENKSSFVAIKRLRKDWFNSDRQARVRGVLLDKIKDTYDYWTIWRIVKNIAFGVQSRMRSKEKTVEAYRKRDWVPPNEYICSGLVQIGFVEAVVEGIKRGELPPETIQDVIFTKSAASRIPERSQWRDFEPAQARDTAIDFQDVLNDELFAVTPEDLAESDKLEWLYLIKDGVVYKVSSYAEVIKLVR